MMETHARIFLLILDFPLWWLSVSATFLLVPRAFSFLFSLRSCSSLGIRIIFRDPINLLVRHPLEFGLANVLLRLSGSDRWYNLPVPFGAIPAPRQNGMQVKSARAP